MGPRRPRGGHARGVSPWLLLVFSALLRVGCDGVVGSGARADACGACGGDNSTCSEARTVSGIFTRPTLPKGLNVVAVLPQGACNLSVAQLRPTKNLLSLRRLNGGPLGRGAPRPGDKHGVYETAGARFTYTPADPLRGFGESLSAAGPLGEPLELMLLYLQPNPGIKYEYTLPVVRREFGAAGAPPTALALPLALTTTLPPPRDAPRDPADNEVLDDARDVRHALGQDVVSVESETRPPTELRGKSRRYVWRVTGLSECSKSCGGGTQQAVVQCVRENSLLPVSEKRCQGQERLASYAVRCGSRPCPAQWVTGDWSGCSVTCGTGTQTRELSCRQEISSTLAVRVADGACLGPKPEEATMQACRMPPCHHHSHRNHHHVAVPRPPPPAPLDLQATPTAPAEPSRASWTVGPWSRCSAECGRGLRTRSVSCPATPRGASNGALHVASCPDGERPADQEACDAGPCGAAAAAGASHTGQAAPFWLASEWSSRCSAQCGAGVQSRLVTCSAGSAGPAGPCDARLRPAHTRACSAEAAGPAGCPGQWFASPWGPCSASCGQGAQSRGVACVQWQRGEARYQVQDDDFCEAHLRPESQQPCAERACPAHWFAGEWSECSRSCGPGAQKREVRCVGPSGPSTMCSEDSKLPTRKPCHLQDCGSPRALAPSSSSPETQDDPADSAFACEDRLRNCHLVVQARLCKYAYYGTSCCHSCRRKVE